MNRDDSKKRATIYCKSTGKKPDFDNLLGKGEEGFVWRTNQDSAIKVYDAGRLRNFTTELTCYEILEENQVSEIEGFTVPHLLGRSEELLVIELSIVSAPYVLDFGKAYINFPPDFSAEVLADYDAEREEMFEGNWDLAQSAIGALQWYGIYYSDARPSNINCNGHPKAVK